MACESVQGRLLTGAALCLVAPLPIRESIRRLHRLLALPAAGQDGQQDAGSECEGDSTKDNWFHVFGPFRFGSCKVWETESALDRPMYEQTRATKGLRQRSRVRVEVACHL